MELYQIKTEHPIVGYCESRIGGRAENQDSYGYHDTPFGLLIVVCDGMGGGPAGKTASSMAVSEILAGVMECEVDSAPKDVLQKAIQRANRALLDVIVENPELTGMGTTCTALLLNEQSAIMAHVGDSRIYQLRRHGKVFRTFDHSLVFDLVKQKVITEEQARLSDQSNIITRALGMKPELEIDIEERPFKKGDRFLLCTDGIHGTMPEKELMALATQRGELGNVVDGIAAMVDGNGKKNGGGHDNLTLVIVETKEKSELKEKMKNKTTLILGIIAAILAVIALVLNSCKNEDIDVDTFRIAEEQVLTGVDTVGITGTYDFFKEAEAMKINIGRDSTLADASSHAVALVGKDYSVIVRNLQANTQYYYNYSVNVGVHNNFITPTKSFRTLQAQDFTIVVSAIPNEGGTVSGGGTYTQGQQCTVTASAHEGYTFMHWTENDSVVSTDSIYRFVVTGNRVLAAQFALLITEPTVTTGEVTDITQTTAKGSGEVNNDGGAAVTERGLCWSTSHNPTVLGNHATSGTGIGTFSVDMSGLTANTKYYVRAYATNSEGSAYGDEVEFTTSQLNNYTVSISANPTNGGTATGGGSFQQGQSCTVRATANTGYTFVNWTESGNQVSANANYTFTVNDNRTLVANFTAGSYIISATVDPENSGTITGAGGYEYGQSCTLKATANTGYTFEKWTENGTQVSTNATYTFSVSGSRSLVAHFKVNSYTITVSANPVAGGVAIGGGTFEYGQSCTLSATANSGYNFSNWTEGGNVVSSNSSYTFTVTGNRTLKANFTQQAPQNYTISVSANPSDGGTVTGGGTYQQGQSCTVRAIANSGYTFSKWTENGNQVSTSANYTFTVTGNRTLVAHFTANPQNYTISVSADPTNGGSVSGGGSYQQGQNCTVSAAANSGYTFSNWTENGNVVSSNTSYSFIVTGNRTLVAHFIANPQSYTITVTANPTNGGTVNGGGIYQQGQSCTVTAEANRSNSFYVDFDTGIPAGWTTIDADGDGYTWVSSMNPGDYHNSGVDLTGTGHNASAHFVLSCSWANGIGQVLYPDNYLVSPQVTINAGSTFSFWACAQDVSYPADHFGVAISDNGTSNWTMVQEWTMTAKSGGKVMTVGRGGNTRQGNWYNYTVDLSVYAGQKYIAIRHFNCSDQFCINVDDVELTGSNGYSFVNWTENGNVVSTNASYTFTVNSNRNLVANFTQQAPQSYHINVSANPSSGGSVSGGGTYQQGQSCTVHATANNGYAFVNWTENGTQVSTNANYTFTVNSNRNLVANFQQQAPQNYTISVSADPSSGGSVSGGGTYQQGQNCTVIASANNGYTFTNWTENGNVVSTNASYSFTVTGNRTLVAHFTANPQSYTISVSANPSNGGSVNGGGTYQQGQSCTVTATANSGFTFTNWTENGNQVSTNASYTFTVTGNRNLVANFEAALVVPTGAINGLFSVSVNQQVWFSQGNLQYQASTNTWKFADNQYQYKGSSNSNISQSYDGWIDLYGWGTSGWNCGNTYYEPWDSDNSCNECYGPPGVNDLTGSFVESDWGFHNAISNGGGVVGQWRTLSSDEWNYIFFTRNTTTGQRYALAIVANVGGVVILPDNWTYGTLNYANQSNVSWGSNVISASQWNNLEQHGAVFLPAAGNRYGTLIQHVNSWGWYWTASCLDSSSASAVYFRDGQMSGSTPTTYGSKRMGLSVRLVQDD